MAVTEHRFRVMASDAHVIAVDAPAGALTDAQQMLERIEQRWSRFLPDSDISRINLADGRPVSVDPLTLTLVATMARGLADDAGPLRPHHPAGSRRRRVPIQHRSAVTDDDPARDHAAPRRPRRRRRRFRTADRDGATRRHIGPGRHRQGTGRRSRRRSAVGDGRRWRARRRRRRPRLRRYASAAQRMAGDGRRP